MAVWLPRSSEVGGLEESGCCGHAEMQTLLLDGHQRLDISQLQAGARHNCCKMQVQAKPRGGVTVVRLVPLRCSAVEKTNTSQNLKICSFDLASLSAEQSRFSCWRLEAAVKTHRASAWDLSGLSSSFHAEAEWKSLHGFSYRLLQELTCQQCVARFSGSTFQCSSGVMGCRLRASLTTCGLFRQSQCQKHFAPGKAPPRILTWESQDSGGETARERLGCELPRALPWPQADTGRAGEIHPALCISGPPALISLAKEQSQVEKLQENVSEHLSHRPAASFHGMWASLWKQCQHTSLAGCGWQRRASEWEQAWNLGFNISR